MRGEWRFGRVLRLADAHGQDASGRDAQYDLDEPAIRKHYAINLGAFAAFPPIYLVTPVRRRVDCQSHKIRHRWVDNSLSWEDEDRLQIPAAIDFLESDEEWRDSPILEPNLTPRGNGYCIRRLL